MAATTANSNDDDDIDDDDGEVRNMYMCVFAGAVPAAFLQIGLTQAAGCRKRHQRGSLSAHMARIPVTLDTQTHAHTRCTDKPLPLLLVQLAV